MAKQSRTTKTEDAGVQVGEMKTQAMRKLEAEKLDGKCVRGAMIELLQKDYTMADIADEWEISVPTAHLWKRALCIQQRHVDA